MWAYIQQNPISEMQVIERCYEGKVSQQSIQFEQEYPISCLQYSPL